MLRFTHKRDGLSLMEALVALFIMAIGMISLLTLFPLGAIQMGRALRDDRCAQCAWQADGTVRTWWQVEVVDKPAGSEAQYFKSMENNATTGVSKVVAIDPIGRVSSTVTTVGGTVIPRENTSFTTTIKTASRACLLVDDVFFNEQGSPDASGGSAVTRQRRYSWMAMIQRPDNMNKHAANLKILVFDGRPLGSTAATTGEQRITGTGTKDQTQVTLNSDPAGPNFVLGKGGWLCDPGTNGDRMDFYRIQSITPNGAQAIIELDTPLKNPVTQMLAFRGLAEVFDRPMLAPTGYLDPKP
jgi:Tfp pilus assembly protein PilV